MAKKSDNTLGIFLFIIGVFALIFSVPILASCSPFDINVCVMPLVFALVGVVLIYLGVQKMA